MNKLIKLLFLSLVLFSSQTTHARDYKSVSKNLSEAKGKNGAVVCVCPHASQVGLDILKAGGNAVDAAIAVQLALAVTWPEAGNIGGGGFMMVHPPGGEGVVCVEYRERAPKAATKGMFTPTDGRFTHKIVGVPGTVHGLFTAHQKFGKLLWKEIVMPAVQLAESGYPLDAAKARSVNRVLNDKATKEHKDTGQNEEVPQNLGQFKSHHQTQYDEGGSEQGTQPCKSKIGPPCSFRCPLTRRVWRWIQA